MILHAGPPIEWKRMCGPMRGAIVGAILYEGWAAGAERARAMAESGAIQFDPCHHHAAVGPMSGIISPSMPVWIVANPTHGNRAFSNLNEGLGKVLRFGANSPEVLERLKWMEKTLAPTLRAGLEVLKDLELKPLMAQALHMGDEVHNRNVAASSLLIKRLVPALLKSSASAAAAASVIEFIAGNDHFFLNISMAACKAMLDAAHGVAGSSMVTVMARNGVEFGIRVSGLGERWFTAPAPVVNGLYSPPTRSRTPRPTWATVPSPRRGFGGFAMRRARHRQFVGGSSQDALANTLAMTHYHPAAQRRVHAAGARFAGTPPASTRAAWSIPDPAVLNTGIAHKSRRRTDRRRRHARRRSRASRKR